MEVYYVIGLDDDWKPQHTMRIASREPITQDNISAAFKNAYAKVVIAQEVSGMGVAVEGEKSGINTALEALNALGDSSTLPDEQRNELEMAIRAALTAQPKQPDVNAELLGALQSLEAKIRQKKGFYAISVGHDEVKQAHKAGVLKGLDVVHEEVKQAIANAEQKGQ